MATLQKKPGSPKQPNVVLIDGNITLKKSNNIMSDIPFEIQMEIIKWLPVKPLIRFRSVSKPWRSVIDSSDFINGYGSRLTQPHSHIVTYKVNCSSEPNFICLVDDDNQRFKVQQQEFAPFVVSPFLKQYRASYVVGACHGLVCLFAFHKDSHKQMLVIWNLSIGKSFCIAPRDDPRFTIYGFGVSPVASDPTVVKIVCADKMPWHVEVFTLSSGVWDVIPSDKLPRQSIQLNWLMQVVIDRFIYWGAHGKTFSDNGESTSNHMVVSFDLIAKEFKVVDLPETLTSKQYQLVPVSKLRESLAVSGYIKVDRALCFCVWVMERDSSFKKLYTIGTPLEYKIMGFRKNGEPIFETPKGNVMFSTLDVYNPYSQQIKNLGISGVDGSFFMDIYKESLLLLDHSDSHIFSDDS